MFTSVFTLMEVVMAKLVALTDLKLRRLKTKDKIYEIRDAGSPGLRIRISPSGSISFRWTRRVGNSTKVSTLGSYPHLSLAEARKKHEKEKAIHRDSLIDGYGDIGKRTVTVSELAELFYQQRILPHRERPEEVRSVLDRWILPQIGKKKLLMLSTQVCAAVVITVVNEGYAPRAGKVLAILKQMLDHAAVTGAIEINPATPLKAKNLGVANNVRDRSLESQEIKVFFKALDAHKRLSELTRIALKLLLYTGVRTGELLKSKWADIDFTNKTWTIPVANQKMSKERRQKARPFVVPLSKQAELLFKDLSCITSNSPYVFASDSKTGRLGDKALNVALRRMFESEKITIPTFVPHDLRRTFRTHIGTTLRISNHIAERCLNHSLGKIVDTYDAGDYLEDRKEILQKWADRVDIYISDDETIVELSA